MLKEVARGCLVLALLAGCERVEPEETRIADEVADSVHAISAVALENLPVGVDRDEVETGRRAYVVCAVCHGLDGLGTPLGPSLRDTDWIHIGGSRDEIAQIIRTGVADPQEYPAPMPVMGGGAFDPDEFEALVTYVHALSQN
ncbi:MAG: c-type cytochrome [Gemmatimonadota bacterium]